MITDPDEAELLLALPGDASSMAPRLGRSESDTAAMLNRLFIKGLVFPLGQSRADVYRMCPRPSCSSTTPPSSGPKRPASISICGRSSWKTDWIDVCPRGQPHDSAHLHPRHPVSTSAWKPRNHVLAFEDVAGIIDQARTWPSPPALAV
jgi:hypothetical protein